MKLVSRLNSCGRPRNFSKPTVHVDHKLNLEVETMDWITL